MLLRRGLGKIAHWGGVFETLVNCAWVLWEGRWIDADLPSKAARDQKTIVGTVAHGDGFYAAQRFAEKHGLPLVVFFQDWWPDMAGVSKPFVKLLDKQFMGLAKSCSLGICVCEGMKKALGAGGNLQVLPPIPAENNVTLTSSREQKEREKFKVLYSGNLDLYGGMLLQALRVFRNHPTIQLQVRGFNPSWPEEAKKEMRDAGLWLDFAPRDELVSWLQSADAFLVPMVFDEKYRRRMETSFPSKLIEFAQFGKPLIVWGPDYCSAVQWGREKDSALCVTCPDSERLFADLKILAESVPAQTQLAFSAQRAAKEEFRPDLIELDFINLLGLLFLRGSKP
jgi:glycosyltransferase involved in cell wall biosynthesis